MKPDSLLNATLDRLLILSLALECAIDNEAFAEADALFVERETVLNLLEKTPPAPNNTTIDKVLEIDARVHHGLNVRRGQVANELRSAGSGKAAVRAYRQAG